MNKPIVELLLNDIGVPMEITASDDVTIVCRFSGVPSVYVPDIAIDPKLRVRFFSSRKVYGKLHRSEKS